MSTKRQGHAVGFEKDTRKRTSAEMTELYHAVQRSDAFDGFSKTYDPISDDGMKLPAESKRVQQRMDELLAKAGVIFTESIDASATKDYGNVLTGADVIVDGRVLVNNAPAPFLIYLKHRLIDLRTFVSTAPVLDSNFDWSKDENSGLFKTAPVQSHRTSKETVPIVKYDATDKHPAQTELITKDTIVGHWSQVKQSGALPQVERERLLKKIAKVIAAVEAAIVEANSITVEDKFVGSGIADYILK
jgi:hypothetical protein